MFRAFVSRQRRTGSEHWSYFTAILHRLKTLPALSVHTCARTCRGVPRTGLCLRAAVRMTMFTPRAHVRKLTNSHATAPIVAVTNWKAWCAAVVPWSPSLFDGCCCCAWKTAAVRGESDWNDLPQLELHRVYCRICSRKCHGERRAVIEACGQQYHAVHSSRTHTRTHPPTRRRTICGWHNGESFEARLLYSNSSSQRGKKRKIRVVEIECFRWKRENYVWRKSSFAFRVCMGRIGSSWSESDPVVVYQFSLLWTPKARATDLGQDPLLHPVFMRASCLPRNREHEKRPPAEEKESRCARMSIWYMVIYRLLKKDINPL